MEAAVLSIISGLKGTVSKESIVFMISMLPVFELRGSLLAAGLLKMNMLPSYILAVFGNMLPIPFLLLFIDRIFAILKKNRLKDAVHKWEKRFLSKSEPIKKYRVWGLFLFVAIPIPGTGAWTGAIVASLLKMKPRKAVVPIFAGVATAGLVMSLISFGVIGQILK